MLSRKLAQFLTCVLTTTLLITASATAIEAKNKKGKSAASRSKGKLSNQAKSSRSRSSRRAASKRSKRGRARLSRYADEKYQPASSPSIVPDQIEVLEHGATNSSDLSKWLNTPMPSNNLSGDVGTITPSRRINIDSMRVIQIQQALAGKGFYSGESTGIYDEATIDSMRRFQSSQKISATGYPTAHALKRLGLASW